MFALYNQILLRTKLKTFLIYSHKMQKKNGVKENLCMRRSQ